RLSERAVADECVDAPERQVPGVARRDPAEAEADSGDVERPAPCATLRQSAEGQRTVRGVERIHFRLPVRVHRPREQADVLGDELFKGKADPDLDVVLSNPAQIRRARILRAVVEAGASSGVLRRISLERGHRIVEGPGEYTVPVPKEAYRPGEAEQDVIVLEL